MQLFDPIKLAEETEKIVVKNDLRKYYRIFRPGRWYGGIATSDCCGCCLRCIFCWSNKPRDHPENFGNFYSPEYIFKKLDACAKRFRYNQLRISGNEPTIGKDHLSKLLELINQTDYSFILETNGILIGHDIDYAKQLSRFRRLHVRVSIKGTNRKEFSILTGASPEAFDLQLNALKNLVEAKVRCHPAVMLSFSPKENFAKLIKRIKEIEKNLADSIEEEYVFLYPHVVERLKIAGIVPLIAYSPEGIPSKLI